MSLVNDYLKQLSRKSITSKGKGGGFVPPSLQRTQKKLRSSAIDKKYLGFTGFIVLLSCFGYLLISVVSILLYPVVDESVAVEPKFIPEENSVENFPEQPVLTNHLAENRTSQVELVAQVDNVIKRQSPSDSSKTIEVQLHNASAPLPKENDVRSSGESEQNAIVAPEPLQENLYAENPGNKIESSMAIEEPRPLTVTSVTADGRSIQSTGDQKSGKRIILKESHNKPDYIYQLALQAQHSNQYGRAERYYRDVLEDVPEHENALVNLSAIYIQEKRIQEAQLLLNKVIKMNPQNSKALVNFGMIELQQNNNDSAANFFLSALRFNPIEVTALRNMAYLTQLGKNYAEAGKYFEQLLRISPGDTDILLAYAALEEMKKKYDSAIKIYRQCLEQINIQKTPERYEGILLRIQVLKQYSAEQSYWEVVRE